MRQAEIQTERQRRQENSIKLTGSREDRRQAGIQTERQAAGKQCQANRQQTGQACRQGHRQRDRGGRKTVSS
jgi:hypothetical protein